jgi:hypothetical protein
MLGREEAFPMVNTSDRAQQSTLGPGSRSQTHLVRAWIAVALVPVAFFLAFAAAEGIYALTGHDPSTGTAPLWADLAAGLPGLAIMLIPCIAGVVYGRRALKAGVGTGWVPAVIAALAGAGAIVLTVANL